MPPSLKQLFMVFAFGLLLASPGQGGEGPEIKVFKTPTCGCCGNWVEHLEASGFKVTTQNMDDLSQLKAENKVPPGLSSCHTAFVDGYVVEGHVPADVIFRLLKERPDVAGITVPGMPQGSPGMETGRIQRYEVLTFDADGKTTVYEIRGEE